MVGFHHTIDISQLWQQISRHISSTKKYTGMISHNPNIHSHFPSNTKLQISAVNSERGSNKQVCVTFQSLDWPLNQLPALLSCIPFTHRRRTDCLRNSIFCRPTFPAVIGTPHSDKHYSQSEREERGRYLVALVVCICAQWIDSTDYADPGRPRVIGGLGHLNSSQPGSCFFHNTC